MIKTQLKTVASSKTLEYLKIGSKHYFVSRFPAENNSYPEQA